MAPILLHGHLFLLQKTAQILIGKVIGGFDALDGTVDLGVVYLNVIALDFLVGELLVNKLIGEFFIHQAAEHVLTDLEEHRAFFVMIKALLADALGIGGHAVVEFGQQNDVFVDHRHDSIDDLGGSQCRRRDDEQGRHHPDP